MEGKKRQIICCPPYLCCWAEVSFWGGKNPVRELTCASAACTCASASQTAALTGEREENGAPEGTQAD